MLRARAQTLVLVCVSRQVKSKPRQVVRLWRFIEVLNAHRYGASLTQLMEELGASRATIYRDLAVLEEAGVRIERLTPNGETKLRLLRPAQLPGLGLNALQVTALRLVRAELAALEGTGLLQELDSLLAPYRTPEKQQHFRFAERPSARPIPQRAEIMKNLERALRTRCRARMDYAKGNATPRTLDIEPLIVNVAKGDPYLLAYSLKDNEQRTYKLSRIQRLEATRDPATHLPAEPPARAFQHSVKIWNGKPTLVQVRLDSSVAWLAHEYPLIAEQTVEPVADGSVTVSARVAGTVEAMRWVLGWGGAAEALSPPELREATQAELVQAVAKYEGPGVAKAGGRISSGRRKKASQAS